MIKHIVVWKLKDQANGHTKQENAQKIKTLLESLNGKIPGMIKLEVGIDFSQTESSYDLALYSEFDSRKHLDAYQKDPLHTAMKPFILSCREERRMVDFEV